MSDSNTHFNDRNPTVFSAEELVAIFRTLREKIATLQAYSYDDFSVLSYHIRTYYQQAAAIFDTISAWKAPDLSQEKNVAREAEKSLKNISSIVTKLQFHDIIRQQLEHIQQTNECIIEELLLVSRQHVRSHAGETYKYLTVVPDIARLHVAQLTHTNKEYQNAFSEIKANLQSIRHQTAMISGTYVAIPNPIQNKITAANQDFNQPQQIIKLADKLNSDISHSLAQLKNCVSFDKIIGEITENLALLIPPSTPPKDTSATENKMITHLKNLYTMESERIVYEQALGKDPVADTTHTETDDNLELF
jgi:hypothetical protein